MSEYAPWNPKNHLEVLDGHPQRNIISLPRKYYYEAMCAMLGLSSSLLYNLYCRRPLRAGAPLHAAMFFGGMFAGYSVKRFREYIYSENEARARYYIETHPDDFPDYEMVKIGDVLEPWIPCR